MLIFIAGSSGEVGSDLVKYFKKFRYCLLREK